MRLTRAQLRAARGIKTAVRDHALLMFTPSPVFAAVLHETADRILLRAANRVGKTRHLAWILATVAVANPGVRLRGVGPTADHIHNVLGKYLAEFLKPHLAAGSYYVDGKGWNGGRARSILMTNGSVIELKALTDEPDAHSGQALHGIGMDEPPKRAHYTENAARLVDYRGQTLKGTSLKAGFLIVAATMVNRPVEWFREMVEGHDESPKEGRTLHTTGWAQHVAWFTRENCPWYTDQQIQGWMDVMRSSPWEWSQRVEGAWEGVTIDRVFNGVTEANFTRQAPPGKMRIGIAMDHGVVAGHQAMLLFAFKGTQFWVMDEHVNEATTSPEEDAVNLLRMLQSHGIDPTKVDLAIGDVGAVASGKGFAGYNVNQAIESAMALQLRRNSPPFRIRNPYKVPGSVHWGQRSINYAGRRGDLKVHQRCVHLSKSLRHWKGKKTGEDGELVHMVDALRYGLVAAVGHTPTYQQLRIA